MRSISSVVVVFPFGESKVARYEPEIGAWTARFLVSQDTPDGTYQINQLIIGRELLEVAAFV